MKIKTYLTIIICSLFFARCTGSPDTVQTFNTEASFPPGFNFSRRGFIVISSFINKKHGTMSTLYGNEIALRSAKAGTQRHAPGLEMALVTWQQQPNPYWFGDNIPGLLLSVEVVTGNKQTGKIGYALFEGEKLVLNSNAPQSANIINFILNQKPSIMP